jgi:MFS family permease
MTPAPHRAEPFKLSSMVMSVYLPTFLFSVGQGAVMPVIPLFALDLGASVAMAGFVVGLRGLGLMLFDVPSGVIVSRFGDKGAMVAGTAMVAVAAVGASMSRSVIVLGVISFIMGGGWAFWGLARFAYVTEIVPVQHRGRAMSLVGGANRVGNFVGPVVGGFLGKHFGLESTFYAQAVMGLAASVLVFMVVREGSGSEDLGGHGIGGRLLASIAEHRRVFLTVGLAVVALQILRQGRTVFLPLWGDRIGLDVAQIGVVVGMASFIDAALFYPAGYLMDRLGRKWASVPSLLLMSLGFLALPMTREVHAFALVAMLIGIGNGFGMGINMTLGADFAPAERRGEFLGVWRFMSDAGGAMGPFAVSVVTGVASLGLASIICAVFGLAGTGVMWRLVPETLGPGRRRRSGRLSAPP